MEKQKIIELCAKRFPGHKGSNDLTYISREDARTLCSLVGDLTKILEEQDEFRAHQNLMIAKGSAATGFQPMMAANFICHRAARVGVEQAVEDMCSVLATKEATLLCVAILRGINCKEEIQLTDNVRLMPIELLPDSRQKQALIPSDDPPNIYDWERTTNFNPPSLFFDRTPKAALVLSIKVDNVLFDSKKDDERIDTPNLDKVFEAGKILSDMRLCLTTTGCCAPLEELRWYQYEDDVLESASSSSKSYDHVEIVPQSYFVDGEVTADLIQPIVKSFFTLSEDLRQRVRTALERLNNAMCRSSSGDKAFELCIALECLLLSSERGDNKFKVSLRAALVAFSDLERRLRARGIIEATYDIRSALVHNGVTKDGKKVKVKGFDKAMTNEVVKEALQIAVIVFQNLIEKGVDLNWNELELSGLQD